MSERAIQFITQSKALLTSASLSSTVLPLNSPCQPQGLCTSCSVCLGHSSLRITLETYSLGLCSATASWPSLHDPHAPFSFMLSCIVFSVSIWNYLPTVSMSPFQCSTLKRVYFVKICGVWSESITLRSKNGRLNLALPLTKEVTSGKELTSLTQWSPP